MSRTLTGVVLVFAVTVAGCRDSRLPGKPVVQKPPNQAKKFDHLFANNCAGCHGDKGRFGAGPPLNDPIFLAIVPDEVLRKMIREGRKGTLMPAFAHDQGGTLSKDEVETLFVGLKNWRVEKKRQEMPAYLPTGIGEVGRGWHVFARACAGCHGSQGQGGKQGGAINEPAFLGLMSDQVLRRLIITGRRDLGMPDYAETMGRAKDFRALTNQDVSDLVALLASWRLSDANTRLPMPKASD